MVASTHPASRHPATTFERHFPDHPLGPVKVRSIRLADVPLLERMHATLSDDSVRHRYFHMIALASRTAPQRLRYICQPDPHSETVLVALIPHIDGGENLVGVARLEEDARGQSGELALLIGDPWQGQGLGKLLLACLIDAARERGLTRMVAYISPDNLPMQKLCERAGFTLTQADAFSNVKAELKL